MRMNRAWFVLLLMVAGSVAHGQTAPPEVEIAGVSCTVSDNPCTVNEGELITFQIIWNSSFSEPTPLSYQVSRTGTGGSAGTGGRSLQLFPGQNETVIRVEAVDDGLVGNAGSVTLTLLAGAGYDLAGSAGDPERTRTVEVLNDDTLSVEVRGASPGGVTEGQPAAFTFSLNAADGVTPKALTVRYEVAQRGDYLGASDLGVQTLTIPAGEEQVGITLATVDDSVDEADGAVIVRLLSGAYSVANRRDAEVRVSDDDAYEVSVTAVVEQIFEGETAEFLVELSSPAAAEGVEVRYSLSEVGDRVSASELGDMVLRFSGRATMRTLTVPTMSDSQVAADGSLTLELLSGAADSVYSLGDPVRATVNIIENDVPNVSISGPAGYVIGEFMVEISFEQEVTGFTLEDIAVDQGSADRFRAVPGGQVYSAWITPDGDGGGSVTVRVERMAVDGDNNRAPPLIVQVAPVTVSLGPSAVVSGEFEVNVVFGGAVNEDFSLTPEDIEVEGGVVTDVRRAQSPFTFDVLIRPLSPTVRVSLRPLSAVALLQDAEGIGTVESSASVSVQVDTESPTVVLSAPETTGETDDPFVVVVSFSEAVTGFDDPDTDVVVRGGEALEILAAEDSDDAAPSYEIMVAPDFSSQTVEVVVREAAARDEAGNPNPLSAASSTRVIRSSELISLRAVGAEAVLLRHAQRFSRLTSSLVRDRFDERTKNAWNLRADSETQQGSVDLASCWSPGRPGSCVWLNSGLSKLDISEVRGGDYADVYGGIDYHNARGVIGVFGGFSSSSLEIFDGRYEANYQEVGAYGGILIGGFVVDMAVGYAESVPQVWRGSVAAEFDAERLSFRTAITGGTSWKGSSAVRLEPRVNLLYISEDLGSFVDTAGNIAPAEELVLGRLEAGPLITVTGKNVLFRLEVPLKWVMTSKNLIGEDISLGVNTSFDMRFSERASLSLNADYDGIGDDYRSYGLGVSLACQLKDGLSLTLAAVRGGLGTAVGGTGTSVAGAGSFDDRHAFTDLATDAGGRLSGFRASLNYRLTEQVTLNFLADQQNSVGGVQLNARF